MENNRTLRIRTNVNKDQYVTVDLKQEYDVLEILSLKIDQKGTYKYTVGDYGVVVGRVLANNGFGVPNAKLSLFVEKNESNDIVKNMLYPFETSLSKDEEGRRYNLLPDLQKDDCHRVVGSFPNKRVMLDDATVLEIFDEYYLYTTKTNDSGDYMFYGVPTGSYTLHMDLDISDCGKLSQKPRDFIYKGYTIEQFENPNQFKVDSELSSLAQIFSQDTTIEVKPFWGDANDGRQIGITRQDINVAFKFEPTCVFMGSIITDGVSEGINKKCVPSKRMGEMGELTTGPGTIQIIRKRLDNTIEELQIKGTQLIDGNGVWCFQIPMNLDYMMTDEYGNMVPTDNPEKGIPTRCEVRFRLSLEDKSDVDTFHNSKILVPHNPQTENELDYAFGSKTKDFSFKSLMWNNVYTIKSFIPRFQKKRNVTTDKFTGIKKVNVHRGNNPMPYNNIRIEMPFMFHLMCSIIKVIINIIKAINILKRSLMSVIGNLGFVRPFSYISNTFCPNLDYWYFAPGMETGGGKNGRKWQEESVCLTFKDIISQIGDESKPDNLEVIEFYELNYDDYTEQELKGLTKVITKEEYDSLGSKQKYYETTAATPEVFSTLDGKSIDAQNMLKKEDIIVNLTANLDYLMQCVETNLAQEYEVIKFDFYNDWINGCVYLPQWKGFVKYKKRRKNGEKILVPKIKGCMNDTSIFKKNRLYVQQCSLSYDDNGKVNTDVGCHESKLRCHKSNGASFLSVMGKDGGIVHDGKTSLGDSIYYLKPYEFKNNKVVPFFATDIVMLGSLFDCNEYGLPSTFSSLMNTTYQLPPSLAQTNLDDDGETYYANGNNNGKQPTIENIKKLECGDKDKGGCTSYLRRNVEKGIQSYDDVLNNLKTYEDFDGEINVGYDDIFPVTEVSGIDWGYNGTGYIDKNGKEIITANKMLAPGGHFLGLSCFNSETNIRSCVNLQRACEIGTSLSERLEIPVGSSDKETNEEYDFDVVNYLYVAPNGLISKDQILDTTFRSAFATMNQNSLRTVVNSYGYKEYDFKYLLPDSFDGSLSDRISSEWTQSLKMDENVLMNPDEFEKIMENVGFKNEVEFESGHTIIRSSEVRSDDYIKFRMGDKPTYLMGTKMPVFKNSFYFYFGLKNGATALDIFKSQFYAPCAPQAIITPKGEMFVDVEWPDDADIDMLNNLKFNIKVSIRGLEKESLKTYTLYRLYNDDFYVINTIEKNGEFSFGEPTTADSIIRGEFSDNDYTISGITIGEYELILQDEYGNELSQNIVVGKNLINVTYDKDSVVNFIKNVDETTQNKKGALSEVDINNYGYITGDFSIDTLTNGNVQYRVVVKRVDNYDSESNKGNFECVRNGSLYYNPKTLWTKWYNRELKRLYLWGYGTYEIWVRTLQENRYVSEFKHSSFVVKNGVSMSFVVGDVTLGLGEIPYDVLYDMEVKYGEWWKSDEWLNDVSINDDTKYLLYRTIHDYTPFNDGEGHNFNLKHFGDKNGMEVIYGEVSTLSGGTWYPLQNEIRVQTNSVNLVTAADDGYLLTTNHIYNTLSENNPQLQRMYPLYYTIKVENDDNVVWVTKFCEGTLKDGIFEANLDQTEKYKEFTEKLWKNNVNSKRFLLYQKEQMFFVTCVKDNNRLKVLQNAIVSNDEMGFIQNGKCILVHLVKLPVLRREFGYVAVGIRGINENQMYLRTPFIQSKTQCYTPNLKMVDKRFKIDFYDYKKIKDDEYNTITHVFLPDSGKNEFTTRYENGVIKNRDKVNGNGGILIEIPKDFIDDENKRENLYSYLKNNVSDGFSGGEITDGCYLCQVFIDTHPSGGVFYYILKLAYKDETDIVE